MNARITLWMRARAVRCALAACLLAPGGAAAQSRWNVVLTPTMDPLPAGFCAAIQLVVQDSAVRDAPRNPLGQRVTIADFDIAVTSPDGRSATAQRIDASHWSACACQGATPGTVATVTATYPSRSLAASARVPGVSLQRSATFALSAAKGAANPAACPAPSTFAAAPLGGATPSARTASGGSTASAAPPTAAPIPVPASGGSSSPPPANSAPAPAPLSGNYLVTLTGVRAFQTSYENLILADGVGDEVYASAYVRRYNRPTGAVAEAKNLKTIVYGDVNNFGTRSKAGSGSATGGIQDGDPIPSGALLAARSAPPQATAFPWKLWEGTLTDGNDVLVITPSLWEQDGGAAFHTQWEQRQSSLTATLFTSKHVQDQITAEDFGSILLRLTQSSQNMMRSINASMNGVTQAGVDLSKGSDNVLFTNFQMPVGNLLAASRDRPIGLIPNGTSGTMLPDHTVVLTREIIEKALARPARGPIPSPVPGGSGLSGVGSIATKPGIIVLDLQDGMIPGFLGFPQRPAKYQLFVQVERIP